jgi:hypothetical protein
MKINGVMDASIAAVIVLCVCLCGKVSGEGETRSTVDKIRGITLSTHRGGRELGDRVILDPSVRAIASTDGSRSRIIRMRGSNVTEPFQLGFVMGRASLHIGRNRLRLLMPRVSRCA